MARWNLSEESIDNVIAAWHNGSYPGLQLQEALGWTWAEYATWVEQGAKPTIFDEGQYNGTHEEDNE